MKTLVFIFLNIVCLADAAPVPAPERYLQANTLYQEHEFAKAYEIYKGIQHKSPELMINIGNAAYQLGKIPEALVRWRKAQLVVKKRDYEFLEKRINDIHALERTQYQSSSWQKLETRVELLMRLLPQKIWQSIFIVICLISLCVLGWYKKRQWLFIALWLLAFSFCASLLCIRASVQDRLMGVALVDTHAYVIKDTDSRSKAAFKACQELHIKDMCDGWYLVSNGMVTGWVKQNDIQLI